MEQADLLLIELEEKMEKSVVATEGEFSKIRTGRANPALLDSIMVEYYGVDTPVKQIATITVPEGNQLYIKPFDRSILKKVEYAIGTSAIGLTPINDGNGIRLILPTLTEELRKELAKEVEKIAESGKVDVRMIRREGNDSVKKFGISEDLEYAYLGDIKNSLINMSKNGSSCRKKKITEILSI